MPALGGVQVYGPNGAFSNNLILPTAGLQNFVPDPSTLVSTNYFGLPSPLGLPAVGPGTTMFPGITLGNPGIITASPSSGNLPPDYTSITKPYVPENREKIKQDMQMNSKDKWLKKISEMKMRKEKVKNGIYIMKEELQEK